MNHQKLLILALFVIANWTLSAQLVSTIAGVLEAPGFNDGSALSARFFNPHGIALDGQGNIYVADRYNHMIRKISIDGIVSTIAGKAGLSGNIDGKGENARFNEPWGICVSAADIIYIADTKNNKIRQIDLDGTVKTIAGTGNFGTSNGQGLTATFGNPSGIEVDAFGNIYVADHLTHIIRKIDNKGIVTTIAGSPYISGDRDGRGREAQFWRPYGLTIDNEGNILVADEWNHKIKKVAPDGLVTTIAGSGEVGFKDGMVMEANFNYPWDLTVDDENNIYIADGFNYVIRKISPTGMTTIHAGIPFTTGGVDGVPNNATFSGATSISWDKTSRNLFIGDAYNHLIRMITTATIPSLTLKNITGKDQICQGEDFLVQASTNTFSNYAFYIDGILFQNGESDTFNVQTLEEGIHQIQVESFFGEGLIKSNILEVEVLANFQPTIMVVGELTFYEGDSIILIANGTGDFLWSNQATTQTITVRTSGVYNVQISLSGGNCPSISNSVQVKVLSEPEAAVITLEGNDFICSGSSTTLVSNYLSGNQWLKGGWIISEAMSNQIEIFEPGFYQVQVEDSTTGVFLFSEAVEIKAVNQTATDFEAVNTNTQPGGMVQFNIIGDLSQNYFWNFGDPNTGIENEAQIPNPTHQYMAAGNYTISLISINEFGCQDTIIKKDYISVLADTELFIPTAFTPNDDGVNDRFYVRGQQLKSFNVQIFDQWGGLLYASNNQEEGWDGTRNGQLVNTGTYAYMVAWNLEGSTKYVSGHVTVLR